MKAIPIKTIVLPKMNISAFADWPMKCIFKILKLSKIPKVKTMMQEQIIIISYSSREDSLIDFASMPSDENIIYATKIIPRI